MPSPCLLLDEKENNGKICTELVSMRLATTFFDPVSLELYGGAGVYVA